MAALSSDTIKVLVNFIPNGFSGTLFNTALMNARSPYGWVDIKSDKTPAGYTYEPTPVEIPEVFLRIPEIFTPNRDGINDKFVIVRPFGMTIDLEVYNRWGSIVYTNRDYQNEWDGKGSGTILGQDLVDGGYYYKIKATNQKGESQFFNGYVVIQR
jgi:gliding motility-associated-like protein